MTAGAHRWSAWYPVRAGTLLERRCAACGAVERITLDALADATVADATAAVFAIWSGTARAHEG